MQADKNLCCYSLKMHSCAYVASRTVTNKSEHLRVNLHALLKIMDVYKYGHLGLSLRKSELPWQLFNFFF
jgi:predicted RNA-binding protein with RPS1 domain